MAVNFTRQSKTEEKKYHYNIAIAAVFDSIYGCLYFVAKTPQAEVKGTNIITYGIQRRQTLSLALCAILGRW